MNNYTIKTERLGLRNWQKIDFDKMAAISSSEKVMEFFPYTATQDQTFTFLDRMIKMFEEKKYCYFAVDILSSKEMIGFIGLCDQNLNNDLGAFTDVGWRLKESCWGNGYATEGAKAVLHYGHKIIGLKKIYATATKLNIPSIRVMEKIGMTKERDFIHPKLINNDGLKESVIYQSIF